MMEQKEKNAAVLEEDQLETVSGGANVRTYNCCMDCGKVVPTTASVCDACGCKDFEKRKMIV